MELDYQAYEDLFNTGDDAALVDRFFAEDCRMVSANGVREGAGELLAFLNWAHDGVREVMRPQVVMSRDGLLFAEVDMDFHASKHRTDFPFGELHPGDLVTVKFFVTYTLNEEGKIAELKSMTWPPETGVSKLPRLGAHPSQRAAFQAYSAAFSGAEFERFPQFYTDDVVLHLTSSVGDVVGKQGIVDFYKPMFARVRETVIPEHLEFTDEKIVYDAVSRFTAVEDAPDFAVGPLKQGEFYDVPVQVVYTLRDGLICDIHVTRRGERTFGGDPKPAVH
ncbi:nuclear transport factor 2 family protein [Croceibacterium aestuarii]|uniref:nuclear transport factor 2 family protein n=1 Tax=Croceibacterium aestuarii TaxID=3064139 RepID=UPI00272E0B8B|nr:nuclear transport factor 2 family protein [Croceibacterium sp. D39]